MALACSAAMKLSTGPAPSTAPGWPPPGTSEACLATQATSPGGAVAESAVAAAAGLAAAAAACSVQAPLAGAPAAAAGCTRVAVACLESPPPSAGRAPGCGALAARSGATAAPGRACTGETGRGDVEAQRCWAVVNECSRTSGFANGVALMSSVCVCCCCCCAATLLTRKAMPGTGESCRGAALLGRKPCSSGCSNGREGVWGAVCACAVVVGGSNCWPAGRTTATGAVTLTRRGAGACTPACPPCGTGTMLSRGAAAVTAAVVGCGAACGADPVLRRDGLADIAAAAGCGAAATANPAEVAWIVAPEAGTTCIVGAMVCLAAAPDAGGGAGAPGATAAGAATGRCGEACLTVAGTCRGASATAGAPLRSLCSLLNSASSAGVMPCVAKGWLETSGLDDRLLLSLLPASSAPAAIQGCPSACGARGRCCSSFCSICSVSSLSPGNSGGIRWKGGCRVNVAWHMS
mmetsp:Transcript_90537/g.251714  ORF Transcript_90537/g.251714 Transcript_90537/m.251714 type:complete len:464 (-) Transcript_90537:1217-2608(-)